MSNFDHTLSIPGYTLQKELGSGAMASVYLAVQDSLDRKVALKVMSASLTTDVTFRERFIKEGKIVAQLNHPHIVTVYDIGTYQDLYYMAMEYIAGGTLKDRIRRGLSPQQALTFFIEIAKALGYAHQRGFVHRDVKPANILFRQEEAVLSDFGIAKSTQQDSTQLTAAGWTLGTPNYMSPEQALGHAVDGRSDLYSLGVVLYEMLTRARPYQGTDSFSTALLHISAPIPRLPTTLSNYQNIIDRLLAKSPEERFTQAGDVIAVGEQLLRRLSTRSQPSSEADATVVVAKQRAGAVSSGTLETASGIRGDSGLLTGRETKGTLPTQDAWAGTQNPLGPATTQPTDAPSTFNASTSTEVMTSVPTHSAASQKPRSTSWRTALFGGATLTAATEKVVPFRPWRSVGSGLLLLVLGGVALYSFYHDPMVGFQAMTAWLSPAPTTPTPPPNSNCPTLDSRTQADVKTLLEVAQSHQIVGYLTNPAGMNAVETYQRVLDLDPCNAQSQRQLNAIADYYFAQTRASMGKQEPISSSLQLAEAGLLAVPTHPQLRTLRQQLRDQLSANRGP